jgi:hypothetical protein
VDLRDIITEASLADAFAVALQRRGLRVIRTAPGAARPASGAPAAS